MVQGRPAAGLRSPARVPAWLYAAGTFTVLGGIGGSVLVVMIYSIFGFRSFERTEMLLTAGVPPLVAIVSFWSSVRLWQWGHFRIGVAVLAPAFAVSVLAAIMVLI